MTCSTLGRGSDITHGHATCTLALAFSPLSTGDAFLRARPSFANPRQVAKLGLALRKASPVLSGENASASVQVACPCVISEPLPSVEHVIERGGGKRREVGPAREEAPEMRTYCR